MTTLVARIGYQWERLYPPLAGIAGVIVGYFWMPHWLHYLHSKLWVIENIFVAIFTLGTVMAGFGLAIYTFLLTTESGFIGRSKKSIYYRTMLTYVILATGISALLAFVSIPGMVIKEAPADHSLHACYVAVWMGMLLWNLAAVVRAGHVFSIFARQHH